ncbi:MAG TPA: MMPL family transporter [Acidimicrobiales bacterium]|nr:MMPL family transporter [Acidimicrobiales bacterium]
MLTRLANTIVRRRRLVLIAALAFFAIAGAIGGGVASHLSSGGFNDPAAQSTKASNLVRDQFHSGDPNVVLLVTARQGTVDNPQVARDAQALTAQLAREPDVAQASSYWSLGQAPPLKSKDGRQALILGRLAGDDDQVAKEIKPIAAHYELNTPTMTVRVGGQAQVFHQVGDQVRKDLERAELYSFIPTLLLLVLVFGSAMAAFLPLAIGGLAVVGTFLSLRVVASLTHVSIFSLNLTTALGLGLAIDYSLFIVSRYREEMRNGREPHAAVVKTVQTAGRTVIFSAATVAISLAALLVFPQYFLKSFAYAGIAVVALAAIGAVVILPAILAALGTRVDLGTLFHHRATVEGQGFWHRLATTVMRRPVLLGGAVILILLFLGSPFLGIRFGSPDDRVLPNHATSRQVQQAIRTNFTGNEAAAVEVVAPTATATPATIAAYASQLSQVPGLGRVDAATGSYSAGAQVAPPNPGSQRFTAPGGASGTWFSAVPTVEPQSAKGEALVKTIRHLPTPFSTLVGGQSAQLVDSKASLGAKLPLAGGIIALVTLTVLFLMTGSVLVPFKAIVLNLLSLSATFGAMVWIFQKGHLASVLHFTPTGTIDTTTPILMFCIAFGLSMDYEVFLLSRIKEVHDRTGDNVASVAMGLERTGRIVTAAAALLTVVFIAFATSQVAFIKLFGIGLAMAVLVDATLVRAVLVPAFMRLAGNANWWAPGPLRRLYHRIGLSETDGENVPALAPVSAEVGLEEVA